MSHNWNWETLPCKHIEARSLFPIIGNNFCYPKPCSIITTKFVSWKWPYQLKLCVSMSVSLSVTWSLFIAPATSLCVPNSVGPICCTLWLTQPQNRNIWILLYIIAVSSCTWLNGQAPFRQFTLCPTKEGPHWELCSTIVSTAAAAVPVVCDAAQWIELPPAGHEIPPVRKSDF